MEILEMTMQSISENKLILASVSVGLGIVLKTLIDKIQNKTATLSYTSRSDRIALSSDDPIFGSVRVTWQGKELHNLYIATIEIENTTTRDFENVIFKLYTGKEIFLLNQRTGIIDTPYAITFSPDYQQSLKAEGDQVPTPEQWEIYSHSREFIVPVFNRAQKLSFSILLTAPNSTEIPIVFASTIMKGVCLKIKTITNELWGIPMKSALIRGLILTFITVYLVGSLVSGKWLLICIATITGLMSTLLGVIECKLERWIKHLIAG